MLAGWHGCEGVARLLLARGADARLRDSVGASALMKACERGHEAVVRVLLSSGGACAGSADSGGNDRGSGAAAHTASELDAQDALGMTALMHASAAGHAAIARLLLKCGADAALLSNTGHSALEWARLAGASGAGALAVLEELAGAAS